MHANNWPKQSQCETFYGNPKGRNGLASSAWESANLVSIPVPWRMFASWDEKIVIRKIRVHRKCAESMARVLSAICKSACDEWERQAGPSADGVVLIGVNAVLDQWGMSRFGGAYSYRLIRGGNRLSMHSYGCAVDFDPARNGMGDRTPNFANCPEVIRAFKAEGWEWGGDWSSPDAMHFQAATVR